MMSPSRRRFCAAAAASLAGMSSSGWLPLLARELASNRQRKRQCVLLWMAGGPSQLDTFDMKPGHANGGEFKEIQTSVPGLKFSEHLPQLAQQADRLAVMRGVSTKEGDHGRGTYLMRTGHRPMGPVRYPSIGSMLAKELGSTADSVPDYVSISPFLAFNQDAFGPGFLGPRYAPITVGATDVTAITDTPAEGFATLRVDDLQLADGVSKQQWNDRLGLWKLLQSGFLKDHPGGAPEAQDTVYRQALALMDSPVAKAFDLTDEKDSVRERYGRGRFGQGCLMTRRLLEQGVPFVEVSLGGPRANWDTHQNNFPGVQQLSSELDAGWATLMTELDERGLLETTTFLWMGEFGRTPTINPRAGRDHFPNAWSVVFAGGGIRGGQAHGATDEAGGEVVDGQVAEGDILATLCSALGVPPDRQNESEDGRPIAIAEGEAVNAVLQPSRATVS